MSSFRRQLVRFGFLVSLATLNLAGISAQEKQKLTIGLIGDSTVATTYGWGPAFEKRFDGNTKILHFAKNGARLDSLSSRLDEMLKLKPNYVLIQFGHNDQKKYGPQVYQQNLTSYVRRVKKAGATPVVLSSVTRRNFGEDGKILPREANLKGNLTLFGQAAREVAEEQNVDFIDLHNLSVAHHNSLGPEASAAYNFAPDDTTHFSPQGAEAIANLILQQLVEISPEIRQHLASSETDE